MTANSMTTLTQLFADEKILSPMQIAQCASFAAEKVLTLCFMPKLPFDVQHQGRHMGVSTAQLAKYFDGEKFGDDVSAGETTPVANGHAANSQTEPVEAWFQAELRLAINLIAEQTSLTKIGEMMSAFLTSSPDDFEIEKLALRAELSSIQAHWISRVQSEMRLLVPAPAAENENGHLLPLSCISSANTDQSIDGIGKITPLAIRH